MGEDPASANVTRLYSLAATNIAIFTFSLFFLYPRFENGTINPWLFQSALATMGVATFSLVFASLHYYRSSLGGWMSEAEKAQYTRRADRFWAFRVHPGVSGANLDPFRCWAPWCGVLLACTLADVPVLRDPLLPRGPDAAGVKLGGDAV